jgi:hypothetical protein
MAIYGLQYTTEFILGQNSQSLARALSWPNDESWKCPVLPYKAHSSVDSIVDSGVHSESEFRKIKENLDMILPPGAILGPNDECHKM